MYENELTQISNQNQLAGYHYRSFTLQIYNCLICNVYSSRTIENASSDQETKSRHIVFAHRINGRERVPGGFYEKDIMYYTATSWFDTRLPICTQIKCEKASLLTPKV